MKLGVVANEFFDEKIGRVGGFGWAARQVATFFDDGKPRPSVKSVGSRSERTPIAEVKMGHERLVSVCLLSWKRPDNLQPIADSLHEHRFIDEVLVWNNNPAVKLVLHGDKVRVFDSPQNMICYGRFLCAKEARHEIIYVQDDDVIVENVPTLYQSFLDDDSRLTHALDSGHFRRLGQYIYAEGQIALLGWGALFKKEWLRVLQICARTYGIDPLHMREADRLFSLLLGRRHHTLPAKIRRLPGDSTPGVALCRDKDHKAMEALAVRRALELARKGKVSPIQ